MGINKRKKRNETVFAGDNKSDKTLHQNLDFTAKEQYKLIRANLNFTLPEGEDGKCPVIGITSSIRGEGKSTTAINLSYVIAEKGSNVLLIDGDLRIPSVAKKLGMDGGRGLSDLLKGNGAQLSITRSPLLDNWYILSSGEIPPNPSELLGSTRMKNILDQLRDNFDYIIIDLPPVNIVSDAISIAKYISGMIIVVRQEYTEKKELERCYRQLSLSGVKILGCVMNSVHSENGSYGKYKKYKYYRYDKYYKYYQSKPADEEK